MLTKRQNMMEVIKGGKPDRFVKQFEAIKMLRGAPLVNPRPKEGQGPVKNAWGVVNNWPVGQPGMFPDHSPENIVIKDFEHWKDYVHAPSYQFSEAEWEPFAAQAEAIDRNEYFVTAFFAPGIFEQCHHLGSIEGFMMGLYEYPDEAHDLIKYLTEFELEMAEAWCKYVHPDAVFHHDDWGTQASTFLSPDMFAEFYLEPYKELYGYYHDHGVEIIIHHSDSYAATLVPYMIEMGINVWQGAMSVNNIPELIKKYGPQITFMGDIDSGVVDRATWTPERIETEVRRACTECGPLYYIPNASLGGPDSTYPGVYDCISEKIDLMTQELSYLFE